MNLTGLHFYLILISIYFKLAKLQISRNNATSIIWCTVNESEQRKCVSFSTAVQKSGSFQASLKCEQALDKDQCMSLIDTGRADLVSLDPGEIFVAGRYNSLVPIMAERYGTDHSSGYYAVAVIHSSFNVKSLIDLERKKACFPGVGQMAGWVIPIGTLMENDIIETRDCNNLIKTAASFFGPSCAPTSLIDKYNPTGDNPQHMCEICGGEKGRRCSGSDPFASFDGAFQCLINGGDVAFLKHTTVDEETRRPSYLGPAKTQFRLLCPNGYTANIESFASCNWGFVPAHSIVTTTAAMPQRRRFLQDFMMQAVRRFGSQRDSSGSSSRWPDSGPFRLFGYDDDYNGRANLMFQDATTALIPLEQNQQTFTGYLGDIENYQQKLLKCPIPPARLCIVSEQEMKKCQKMRTAFRAQMLKPDLVCVNGFSQNKCMQMIAENLADLVILDAGDIYYAGKKYNLMPIVAEQYDLEMEDPSYYVVAIAKQADKTTDLMYLRGKRSCHTGIGMAAGWIIPLSFLLSNERMRAYGCDTAHAAAEYFTKSCAPGALSREYTVGEWQYDNLCDLCHGSSYHYCSRSSQEPFFGHTGALRCLIEGGGEIAFAKHTTIRENTAGKNPDYWSRPLMPDDFELLCRDGTRAAFNEHENCYLAIVSSNAIVTHKHKPSHHVSAYIDLFMYAQQYYGSKFSDAFTFKMFVSEDLYSDLIFQDATQQLKVVPEEKRDHLKYLGDDFLQALRIVDCTASGVALIPSCLFLFIILLFTRLL